MPEKVVSEPLDMEKESLYCYENWPIEFIIIRLQLLILVGQNDDNDEEGGQ